MSLKHLFTDVARRAAPPLAPCPLPCLCMQPALATVLQVLQPRSTLLTDPWCAAVPPVLLLGPALPCHAAGPMLSISKRAALLAVPAAKQSRLQAAGGQQPEGAHPAVPAGDVSGTRQVSSWSAPATCPWAPAAKQCGFCRYSQWQTLQTWRHIQNEHPQDGSPSPPPPHAITTKSGVLPAAASCVQFC